MLQAMLLYPPITDPTSPYHSLTYVASFARHAGFTEIEVRDTNIEALSFCARPEILSDMKSEWQQRRRMLGFRRCLSVLDQLEYIHLTRAEAVEPQAIGSALAIRHIEWLQNG
jgi:anaerobic magnesium-protoporphyrin IX monomethyl ester cyclase